MLYVISGKYPISLFRMLKFYKRDFYVIATQSTPEQKEEMLSLIGVYMEAGYYAINYDNVQHYRIFPSADPQLVNQAPPRCKTIPSVISMATTPADAPVVRAVMAHCCS